MFIGLPNILKIRVLYYEIIIVMTTNYGVVSAYDPMRTNNIDVTFVPTSLTP